MKEPKAKYRSTFDRIDFLKIAEATIHNTAPCKAYAHFRIDHTRRVYHIACHLAGFYHRDSFDIRKLGVMCAIHDMFKYATENEHGEKAAKYLKDLFIDEYISEDHPERTEWMMVVEAINHHSLKDEKELPNPDNIYLQVLMDADMLDKIHSSHVKSLQRIFYPDMTLSEVMDNKIIENESYIGKSIGYDEMRKRMLLETKANIKYKGER